MRSVSIRTLASRMCLPTTVVLHHNNLPDQRRQAERELLRNEIAVMKLLKHPSIVRLEAVYETRQSMFIVLEKVTSDFSRGTCAGVLL